MRRRNWVFVAGLALGVSAPAAAQEAAGSPTMEVREQAEGDLELPGEASDTARERARPGLDTAEERRQRDRSREQAREHAEAAGEEAREQARQRAREGQAGAHRDGGSAGSGGRGRQGP
jgi:hypothetical protein